MIAPFNEYGRSKYEAEEILRRWQQEDMNCRTLVIVRPTVVFGEGNRGNVYNFLKQLASGRFVMVGKGRNVKSMAYVENVAAFLEHDLSLGPGIAVYNYVDKPDFDMNTLIRTVREEMRVVGNDRMRIPYAAGMAIGYLFDLVAFVTGRSFPDQQPTCSKVLCDDTVRVGCGEDGLSRTCSSDRWIEKNRAD